MIRRGFIYRVARVFRDPKRTRPVLVMTVAACGNASALFFEPILAKGSQPG